MFEENKSEQGENKKIKDFLKDQAKEDITLMLKKFNTEMIKTRNLNQIEVDQIKQAITNRYLSELNLILMSN
jgi:EAL domain-containing protein (putative c-di-GMP-specific phosphodiesterase class I)